MALSRAHTCYTAIRCGTGMTSQVNVLHMCQNAKTLIIIDDNANAKFTEYLLVVFSKF